MFVAKRRAFDHTQPRPNGRVAESGLRHSTRNRAWGNPPWVRIPPLPPVSALSAAKNHGCLAEKKRRGLYFSSCFRAPKTRLWQPARGQNVTIKDLIPERFAPHIVCPPMTSRYYLLSRGIHKLLAPLSALIHR